MGNYTYIYVLFSCPFIVYPRGIIWPRFFTFHSMLEILLIQINLSFKTQLLELLYYKSSAWRDMDYE